MTQHQLAESLSISDPAISRALRPLELKGLVRIDPDPTHGRRRLVSPTRAGSELFQMAGRPLSEDLRVALIAADFPYDRYLADTTRLARLLGTNR
jgi:DNA-binding MarR family transcriptional regulator